MTEVKAVIFDFGGVLYRTPNTRLLLGLMGMSKTKLLMMSQASPLDSPLVMDIMTGKTQEQAVWEEFAQRWHISPGLLVRIRQLASSPKRLNNELLRYLASLRGRFKTAILTNAGTDFRKTFCADYALINFVDQVIISAEEGLAKPDLRIYQLTAVRLGIQPEEAIFIDDFRENVAGASAAGMQAIWHQNNKQTIMEITQRIDGKRE
jgi:epoxide hydrolase-like predicted phosphatase